MSDLILQSSQPVSLPLPSVNVTIRPGVLSDVPFLDSLQKLHTKQVGWMPTAQFEGKIKLGHVLIAESDAEPVGYCIGNDQYFKRDDVGIIYQMNVAPGKQRGFIGGSLLKAQFERSAYGCKLYCCWCAQDIAANKFWEAMGFVALAFRSGSAKKSRTHIFWQKRIRSGDTITPYWFPSQTSSGSIREDRIVLPIPPGTYWSDAKPMILPGVESVEQQKSLPIVRKPREPRPMKPLPTQNRPSITPAGLRFAAPVSASSETVKPKREPKQKTPRVKPKNDPRHVAAARELRDRWLEEVNAGRHLPASEGKYEISRSISEKQAQLEVPRSNPIALIAA